MPYRRRSRSSGLFSKTIQWGIFLALLGVGANYVYKQYFCFNPEKILAESVLKEKTFASKPVEVVSPKYKIKAYLLEERTAPIISFSFMFKGAGRASDDKDKQGISALTAAMLMEGTKELTSQEFKEKLEDYAIGISFSSSLDDFSGSLVATSEHQEQAYALLKDVLTSPRFDEEDMLRNKLQLQKLFLMQKEHPQSILNLKFAEYLYGDHPYGRNPLGKWEDASKLTSEDLRNYMQTHLAQNNLIIGVSGDISADALGTVLDDIFGSLPQSTAIDFVRNPDVDFKKSDKNIEFTAGGQNISRFATKGVARDSQDFYPLYVANHIFGGSGLSSRLSKAAREEKGLTYNIYTYMSLADKSPLLQGGFSSTADKYKEVEEILRQEWNKFGKFGASKEEVENAKKYLLASYNLRFASVANLSEILLYMQKDNLGLDFLQNRNQKIKKISTEEVNKAAQKYFRPNGYISVNIGSFTQNKEK